MARRPKGRRWLAILLSVAWILGAAWSYLETYRPSSARAHFSAEGARHLCESYAPSDAGKTAYCQGIADETYASEMRFHAENYEAMLALSLAPVLLAWLGLYLWRVMARRRHG
ncbi:MAG: hypothetical protein ACHQF3_10775 [Alphaproteobacteria bacterium]